MVELGIDSAPRFHYLPTTEDDRAAMLQAIGAADLDDLFADIPADYRNPTLDLPGPLSELELRREMEAYASRNRHAGEYACFLGAGAYNHFAPSVVRAIISRGEFLTSYTPYQPEISQGTLQVTYEFQSMICSIYEMEVANAGLYDGASALAEAALMACRVTGRTLIGACNTLSPAYREVLETYCVPQGLEISTVEPGSHGVEHTDGLPSIAVPQLLWPTGRLGPLSAHVRRRSSADAGVCRPCGNGHAQTSWGVRSGHRYGRGPSPRPASELWRPLRRPLFHSPSTAATDAGPSRRAHHGPRRTPGLSC